MIRNLLLHPSRRNGQSLVAALSACVLFALSLPGHAQTTTLTYENWAQGFITHNCLGCHHSSLEGEKRFGAPADINFDTLDQIREWSFEIHDAATGDNPSMPPTGVVWWWDRISLREWIAAGMPGNGDSLQPVEIETDEHSLSYEVERFHFSGPLEGEDPNLRRVEFGPYWEEEYEGVRTWRSLYILLNPEGGASLVERTWETRDDDWDFQRYRAIEYSPPIPLLMSDPDNFGETWEGAVSARERKWRGWWGGTPVSDVTRQESWRVRNGGIEKIDNGVIRPPTALKMVLANLTNDTTETIWFEKGMGIMRREFDAPSSTYIREVTREMNIVTREYPLGGPFDVEDFSDSYLPLHARWYDGGTNWGYGHEFEIQKVGVVKTVDQTIPTPTNTLAPDPTNTYSYPTPTVTPFPSGLPSPQPTFTASPTQATGFPSPTPTGGDDPVDPSSPLAYDHNKDRRVDQNDLLMFLKHWQMEME